MDVQKVYARSLAGSLGLRCYTRHSSRRAGVAQLAERELPKLEVVGSRPIARSRRPPSCARNGFHAHRAAHRGRFARSLRRPSETSVEHPSKTSKNL